MRAAGRRLAQLAFCAALLAPGACEDLRQFSGDWDGEVSHDLQHQLGFTPGAKLHATVGSARREKLELALGLPGRTDLLPFDSIGHAADDVLGDVRLPGEPLRTYFGFVTPPAALPYLTVVSLFGENRVEVRLIRGASEAYGVFYLARPPAR